MQQEKLKQLQNEVIEFYKEIKKALRRIEEIACFVEVSCDIRVKTLFFTQAGIIRQLCGFHEQSINCFERMGAEPSCNCGLSIPVRSSR